MKENKYVIMYTCYKIMSTSHMGKFTGKVEMLAKDRKDAERIFYELNQPYILGVENGEPIYNYAGGYICECVLTYEEWVDEGSPETL